MFTIYDLKTGEIIKTITCPEFLIVANTPDGFSAIFGDYSDDIYKIDVTSSPHKAVLK